MEAGAGTGAGAGAGGTIAGPCSGAHQAWPQPETLGSGAGTTPSGPGAGGLQKSGPPGNTGPPGNEGPPAAGAGAQAPGFGGAAWGPGPWHLGWPSCLDCLARRFLNHTWGREGTGRKREGGGAGSPHFCPDARLLSGEGPDPTSPLPRPPDTVRGSGLRGLWGGAGARRGAAGTPRGWEGGCRGRSPDSRGP